MYLTQINNKTGLLDLNDVEDGLMAIKEFRVILNNEDLGLECLTAIALVADYTSPIRYYDDNDRPRRAMEEVTGNRDIFTWKRDDIQEALIKYDELQYDPTLVEGKIHYQRKVNKLREYEQSEKFYGKGLKGNNGEELTFRNPTTIASELRTINADIKQYEDNIQGKDVYSNAPTKNGYTLTRLEEKINKKGSFYKSKR